MGFGLAEDVDQFASRLGIVSGKVSVRSTLHAGTLKYKTHEMKSNKVFKKKHTPVRPIRWM